MICVKIFRDIADVEHFVGCVMFDDSNKQYAIRFPNSDERLNVPEEDMEVIDAAHVQFVSWCKESLPPFAHKMPKRIKENRPWRAYDLIWWKHMRKVVTSEHFGVYCRQPERIQSYGIKKANKQSVIDAAERMFQSAANLVGYMTKKWEVHDGEALVFRGDEKNARRAYKEICNKCFYDEVKLMRVISECQVIKNSRHEVPSPGKVMKPVFER